MVESGLTIYSWAGVFDVSYGVAVGICTAAEDKRVNVVCLKEPVNDTLWFAESPKIQPAIEYIITNDHTQIRGIEGP
ncbi:MAG: hypothetical protein ACTSYL_04505 [Candidatus Thorarchaeota archaeon]